MNESGKDGWEVRALKKIILCVLSRENKLDILLSG